MVLRRNCIVRRLAQTAILLVIFMNLSACRTTYSSEVKNALKKVYTKNDFPGYQFRDVPVGSFGVGTMYPPKAATTKLQADETLILEHPSTWWDDSLMGDDAAKKAAREEWMKKIVVAGPLGTQTVTSNITKKLGLAAVIPGIAQVLSAGANLNMEKGVTVTVTAKEAENRILNWGQFLDGISKNALHDRVGQHLQDRDFMLVTADLVLAGYNATVKVDQKANADLKAKLDQATTLGKLPLGKDTSVEVKASSTEQGTYTISVDQPVVVARVFQQPTPATPLSSGYDNWPVVRVENKLLEPLEIIINRR